MTNNPTTAAASKFLPIDEIAARAAEARAEGLSVVQAHGTFDLLHIGHLRHLRLARNEGDRLVVTLTGDSHVNKGPGRPVFSENMRAEMIAALECVDYVGIVHAPLATEAIEKIKPQIYAKGPDYLNAEDDVTGGIVLERNAVEANGGRVAITEDITFSSSALINRNLPVFEPELREYLESQRETLPLDSLFELIYKVKDFKVLVVGDAIIDEYIYVRPMAKAPKENMIATLRQDREVFSGGVFAAANHLAGLCKEVHVLTCVGAGCEFREQIEAAAAPNVRLHCYEREDCPTTRKTRYIDEAYFRKLFEVYDMDDAPLDDALEAEAAQWIADAAKDFDLVVVTDFGHGMISPRMIQVLRENARFLAANAQTNSANFGFNLITRYPGADFICIDAPEARLAMGDRQTNLFDLVSERMPDELNCDRLIVTNGKNGCIAKQRGSEAISIPALTRSVVDTVGAGDAFFAVASPLVAAGGDINRAAFIGNAAGAIKVGILGHRKAVDRASLMKYLTTLLK